MNDVNMTGRRTFAFASMVIVLIAWGEVHAATIWINDCVAWRFASRAV
jgi:hypothetical protein